jgi:hypothetical protein
MIEAIQPATDQWLEDYYNPALKNDAVAVCAGAWQKIHTATLKKTENLYTAERCANIVYRLAMPPLSGYQNICDFIACVGYGMLLGAIKPENGTKLLYAAQVALSTIPQQAKTQTRTQTRT